MAFKNIDVALRLLPGQFVAGVGVASQSTKQLAGDLNQLAARSDENLRKVSTGALLVGGAILAGFGVAAVAAMNFEAELSNLQAVSGATGEQMATLGAQAIQAGADTVFSASEAAKAQVELAKAGVSLADILGGALEGALNLASAGGLELAQAAELAANAMTTFKLGGSDVPRIADALAAGANKSAADVAGMGQSLQQSGLVAAQLGLTLEETVGTLSMFAQAGMQGSDAGTSFKTMLMRLNPQSAEAKRVMDALGLAFFDARGEFVGIEETAEQLRDRMGQLTQAQQLQALQTIFGADAIRAATILYDNGGAGVTRWTEAVTDSGYAAELAAVKTDNLKGDLEALGGSFETVLIQGGSQATGVLRSLTQGVTDVVNGFGALPGPLQTVGLGFAGLVGVGLTALGTVGTLAPKVHELRNALTGLGSGGAFVARNLGSIAGAAGIAGVALVGLSFIYGKMAEQDAARAAAVERYTRALRENTGALEENMFAATAESFATGEVGKIIAGTSADIELLARAVRTSGTELDRWRNFGIGAGGAAGNLRDQIRSAADSGDVLARELLRLEAAGELSWKQIIDLVHALDYENDVTDEAIRKNNIYTQVMSAMADVMGAGAGEAEGLAAGQGDLSAALDEATRSVEDQKTALQEYQEALKAMHEPVFALMTANRSNVEAQRDLIEAQHELNEAIREHGPRSEEAAEASLRLAAAEQDVWESAVDAEVAVIGMADALRTGQTSFSAASAQLDELVAAGRMTAEQADNARLQLFFLTLQANQVDLGHAVGQLNGVAWAAGGLEGILARVGGRLAALNPFSGLEMLGPGLGRLSGRATGGPVAAHVPYLVGEEGEEIFVPDVPGRIIDARRTASILAASRLGASTVTAASTIASTVSTAHATTVGPTYQITVHANTPAGERDGRELARQIIREIRAYDGSYW